ncbi:hypothetical protein KUTeg_017947 [Tegillarca granosa]|uniref:Activating signal cointegrator 1 n=1 Tax=Tegillarca granosa TaxID=220873 RepID=A0ABQ9EHY3_TEGGR|nr:hypothetical protein KUTeg_017947 [Tegillarca granosa]
MATSVEKWMCDELAKLGLPASEENAKYILGIGSADEIEEYMLELLDNSDPKTHKFIKELIHRWRPPDVPKNIQVYRKKEEEESYFVGSNKTKQKDAQNSVASLQYGDVGQQSYLPLEDQDIKSRDSQTSHKKPDFNGDVHNMSGLSNADRKKQKFVPLYSQEGQAKTVVKLPGRHPCECQASKHSLVSNCVRCGRIVCEQEGSGPCLFCGQLVCTAAEQEILARGSKKSEQLRHRLMTNADRLNYVSNSDNKKDFVRRTQVIDDESDYYATDSNKWLSTKEREMLRKREEELRSVRHASKKDRKITLDFAGRRVIEEGDDVASSNMYDVNDSVVQQVHYGAKPKLDSTSGDLINPSILSQAPKFVLGKKTTTSPKTNGVDISSTNKTKSSMRIQDKELQEMTDEGMCLSMHQPWALLLVKGIKMHEGRTWYSAHRGRLWIAATAKSPTPEEIADVQD